MEPDRLRSLLHRVRWANFARLIALPAVVLAVVAWARMAPAPPALPDATARPVPSPSPRAPARKPRGVVARGVVTKRHAAVERRRVETLKRRVPALRRRVETLKRRVPAGRRRANEKRRRGGQRRVAAKRRATDPKRRRLVAQASRPGPVLRAPAPSAPPDPVAAEFGTP